VFAADRGNTYARASLDNLASEMTSFLSEIIQNDAIDEFLIVASAGNTNSKNFISDSSSSLGWRESADSGQSGNVGSFYGSYFSAITNATVRSRIVVVGSIGLNSDGTYYQAESSNRNPDAFAPGRSIYSTLPSNNYGLMSGTSMAAPHVSGVAAMVWGANEHLSGADVKNIILNTCTDGDLNIVNANSAVKESLNETTPILATITGAVVEQGTNTPLSGVLVEVTKVGSTAVVASTTTNASGYLLLVEPNTTYNLKFTKAGYEEQTLANVNVGDTIDLGSIAMARFTTAPHGRCGMVALPCPKE